jgi:glycosyltransferase involved in cell wall biosynthesis
MSSNALSGIRIARISTVPFFVATQLKHQIETLGHAGADVTVVSSDGPELASLKGLSGVRCETVDIPRSISPWRDLHALTRLYRFFRRERIQIAHSTTPKAGLLTALAAFLAGVPVRLHTFTGQPWLNMRGPKRWLARSSDWLIGKLDTRCYADSISQRRFLIDQKLINGDDLLVIGAGSLAGVDIRRFDSGRFAASDRRTLRRTFDIPDDAPVLLFVGRITVDKGVRELLQAFRALRQVSAAAHLIFVGQFDTDSGVAGYISRSEIEQLPDTHIVGYSDRPEAYMAIADILCLPSYREGFGTVVIEAAAMGLPTVGTDIYGLSDAVVHGETGLLVPSRDAGALAGAIGTLLADEALRGRMSEEARHRARTLFDAELVSKLLMQEYADLLQARDMEE